MEINGNVQFHPFMDLGFPPFPPLPNPRTNIIHLLVISNYMYVCVYIYIYI